MKEEKKERRKKRKEEEKRKWIATNTPRGSNRLLRVTSLCGFFIDFIDLISFSGPSSIVGGGADTATGSGPVGVVILAGLGSQLVGVCTKKVPERLQEVGGEIGSAVAIEKGQGGAECWGRETSNHRVSDDPPPALLAVLQGLDEEGVKQEALEVRILVKGLLDVSQELAAVQAITTTDSKREESKSTRKKKEKRKRKKQEKRRRKLLACE